MGSLKRPHCVVTAHAVIIQALSASEMHVSSTKCTSADYFPSAVALATHHTMPTKTFQILFGLLPMMGIADCMEGEGAWVVLASIVTHQLCCV